MKSAYYLDTLRGRSQELPAVRSKVVRVFVSSTFTDTLTERDSLIENIFPKLKDYCREKYGLEFQYADMRWGIQTESANNHGEVATCLKEIELCKKYSVATNFVVLLGNRYGSRPIPAEIPATLFELLKSVVVNEQNENNENELLTQWYQLDTNSLPTTYVLQNISSILPEFISKDTDAVKRADKQWKSINNRLRRCLRQAAATCLERQQITEKDYDEFFISVTEKEIIDGILSASDANERTLCFFREIVDIRDHLSDEKASKYIDMISSDIDHEAEKLLDRLKNVRLPPALKSSNIYKYRVHWSPKGIDRSKHAEYINQFNEDFYTAMKDQIDRCVQSRFASGRDGIQHEVLEHAIQCKACVAKFHGRVDVLSQLEVYVKKNSEHRPCVVFGDSGCGKTSVLAKAATEVFHWWSGRSVSVILRFLGTTPASSTIYKTLLSISEQICEIYRLTMTAYPTVNQLRDQLESNLLSQIPDDEYLLILLDSIDQLHSDAYDCKWLFTEFPSNVKCILSTLPDHGDIYQTLQKILVGHGDLFVHVPPFQPSTVEIVFKDWLRMKHRSLSESQWSFIKELMQKREEILPLFMKLLFDIISIWHSYDPIDERLQDFKHVDDCIRYLFQRLQVIHHTTLFSRALCYMTACRSGISQNELEDVLSLDDEVLKSVFQHYIPPVRRLPGILWTRIRNDLDEYITEKEIDDAPVIFWYHRRFIEVAKELYVSDLTDVNRRLVFQNLVDLFQGTWKGKNKPFKIDDPKLMNKYHLDQSGGEIQANRFIASQPIEFVDVDGNIQYNKRKLNELPLFLSQLTADISIPIAAKEIFFNYSFMHAKFSCSTFIDIHNEISLFKDISAFKTTQEVIGIQKEIGILSITYMVFGMTLNDYPNNFAFEFTSRLLPMFNVQPNITKLIKECDELSPQHCALIVPYYQLPAPGNGLIYSMNKHTMPVVDLDFSSNQDAAISLSNKIIVINMRNADTALEIKLPVLSEPYLNSTTIQKMSNRDEDVNEESSDSDNDVAESTLNEQFKKYVFVVNSHHHVYLISSQGDVRFHRTSSTGFDIVQVIDRRRALCLLVERDSSSIECWNVGQDKLYAKLDFISQSSIKTVLWTSVDQCLLIAVVLHDGTLLFYMVKNGEFRHRGTINAGKHLDLVVLYKHQCICSFDASCDIDLAHIDLRLLTQTEDVYTDDRLIKTLIAFDPPIGPKPIERLILPESEKNSEAHSDSLAKIFFVATTKEAMYIVHVCSRKNLSYVRIPGHPDLICIHVDRPLDLYTIQGGIVNLYKWKCLSKTNVQDGHCHGYRLFVSIDISSSAVLAIRVANESGGLFLCSMQNGLISAYHTRVARESFKKIPPFPRATEVIGTIQLAKTRAITLDVSKKELTSWVYQHSASIDSTRCRKDSEGQIEDYAVLDNTAVLLLTSTSWIEVYSLASLDKKPIFRLHVRCPGRVFTYDRHSFVVFTNDGLIRCISEQIDHSPTKFIEISSKQLKIACSKMFVTLFTSNSKRALGVLADDTRSLTIWTPDEVISMKIDLSQYASTKLSRMTSEPSQEVLLFYFENKSLVACQIHSSRSHSYHLTAYDTADIYCLKNNCLATVLNGERLLNLHNIHQSVCHEPILLESLCEQLCLSESGAYLFALVQPRILCMFRVADRRPLGRLFVYDFVSTMVANDEFVVLAMNDRRLLTLMIADPDDPQLQSKIQALPSRNIAREENQLGRHVAEQIDQFLDLSSSEDDSDMEAESNVESELSKVYRMDSPSVSYRFLYQLRGQHPLSKMKTDEIYPHRFLEQYVNLNEIPGWMGDLLDDSEGEAEVEKPPSPPPIEAEHNLDDIRARTVEYDRQQLKGVQLANAGSNNLKIVNNYSVTSNTCALL